MLHRVTASPILAGLVVAGLLVSAGVDAAMYRYTDENGQLVISNTIPQEATRRGYDILSDNGRVIERVPRAPTDEEIAAREAEKERERQREFQKEQDRQLLKRFSHPNQATRAMHRKIQELPSLIQLKRGNISRSEERRVGKECRARGATDEE